MNKYEKMMYSLKAEYDVEYGNYVEKKKEATREAVKQCNAYNDNIHRINATRDNLLTQISSLYKFLKRFGNMDKKITPFDYVNENSQSVETDYEREHLNRDETVGKTSGFVKTATAVGIVAAPVLLPAIWIGDAFHKRSKCKEEYFKMLDDYEKQKNNWEHDIIKKNQEAKFYETASKIAYLYQSLIMTVKQAVEETILPELTGIDAFLIADAIKNNIISDMNPEDADIAKISMYKDTIYDCHFTFVENTFDYYTLIVKFFSEPILTRMMEDSVITPQEETEFNAKKKQIEEQTKQMVDASVFGGSL